MSRHWGAERRKAEPPAILLPPNPSPSARVWRAILRLIAQR